ncbi:MAG: hypothetical protein WC375_07855 [Methanomassiliicoccales archaeon]
MNSGLFALVLLSAGCSYNVKEQPKTEVAAVYWHEASRFSVAIEDGQNIKFVALPSDIPVTVTQDVLPGEKLWYEYREVLSDWSGPVRDESYVHIHVRNIDDLRTGEWNHGKFGRGETVRLEE